MSTEIPVKKPRKEKSEKPNPVQQITVTADGDFLVIRMPKKLAVKHLLSV